MIEGWTTESVLKKHGLWRELAGPLAGPTAIKLQWQDMQIEKLRNALLWIASMADEDNEWDGVDRFRAAREKAIEAIGASDSG